MGSPVLVTRAKRLRCGSCQISKMPNDDRLTPTAVEIARERRPDAVRMQEIEDNPRSIDQISMFERESWSHERRQAHILAKAARPD